MKLPRALRCAACVLALVSLLCRAAAGAAFAQTDRGMVVETERYRATITNGVVVSFVNKLTSEEYLDLGADLSKIVPHLPSGLGTQNGEGAMETAAKLHEWPWWEHPIDMYLPNQHFPTAESKFTVAQKGDDARLLTYQGLSDGRKAFADETYSLTVEVDKETGDLLLTPAVASPRPGVYAANITVTATAPWTSIEAPIMDGIRLTEEMQPALWVNRWACFWDYAFLAINGARRGAVGIWAQDADMYYKHFYYLVNDQGISFSLSTMNTPPFEKLTEAKGVTWRFQVFDKHWAQAAARFRQWREKAIKFAPRPEWSKQISLVSNLPGAQKMWLDLLEAYVGRENLPRTLTFGASIRRQPFDRHHWDNAPYDGFAEDMKEWNKRGAYLMAYLQPMIMWGGPKQPDEEEKKIVALAKDARSRSPFHTEEFIHPFSDDHHLGHPEWQKWFLGCVDTFIRCGAHGVYHDSTYSAPVDARGLIGGMRTTQGMADYFYKAAAQHPGTVHGTEHLTEANTIGASFGISSGFWWGTMPSMRPQRLEHASAVTGALSYPHAVMWNFRGGQTFRDHGNTYLTHVLMDMVEKRGEIAGHTLNDLGLYAGKTAPFDTWRNELWLERERDMLFLRYGLRPVYPEDWDRSVASYYVGAKGEQFCYELMPWGTRFVQIEGDKKTVHYARIHGLTEAAIDGAIAGWAVYTANGPSGLHPERHYTVNPKLTRPAVHFDASLYESYVEDGFVGENVAMIRVRPLSPAGAINPNDRVKLRAPQAPAAVYVDGKPVTSEPQNDGAHLINIRTPADICIVLKEPAPGFEHPRASASGRVIPNKLNNTDIVDAAWFVGQFQEGKVKVAGSQGEVEVQRLATMPKQVPYGLPPCYFQLHVALKAPEGKSGTLRLHLAKGRGYTTRLTEFLVNGQPADIVCDREKAGPVPVAFGAGETKVLSLIADAGLDVGFEWASDVPKAEGGEKKGP